MPILFSGWLPLTDFVEDFKDYSIDLTARKDFRCVVLEQDIRAGATQDCLLGPVGFAYPAFQQIAFDGTLEQPFWYGNHYPRELFSVRTEDTILEAGTTAPLPLAHKGGNADFAT